ncbi:MAG: helix-turn-helix protein [Mucilaginibacter sp.]|nr:helix-turn-helix protein [Mucilaginibacter sp.]
MIDISILALKNAVLASVADSRYVFVMVNEFLKKSGKAPLFNVQVVGFEGEVKLNGGLFSIHPDVMINDIKNTNLIIIPALSGDIFTATTTNINYVSWINEQYRSGAEVASLCTGAFLLAFSGLLKGRQCTTHWLYANEFRHHYASVTLVDEKAVTDQNGLYSSGGNNTWWSLLLHLVEKYAGREIAIHTAKYFVVDLDRNTQSPFIIFNGRKDHGDEVIIKSQEFIEQNYPEKFSVDELASRFGLTRRTFERRFKKGTRNTVAEYIQRVKIEAAKKQLEIGRKPIMEIMLDVGYSDVPTFREVFKRITGMTPVEYKSKYISRPR